MKMKDSGVELIGEIPEGWEIRKINAVAKTVTDYVASGSFADLRDNVKYLDYPDYAMLIRTADLSGTKDMPVYIDKKSYNFLSNSNLFGGEIILSNIGSVGNVYLYEPLYKFSSLAPNSIMLNGTPCNKYLYYYFQAPPVNTELKNLGGNAVQIKFNKTQLRQFKVLQPPKEIQKKIATYLDEKCSQIEQTIQNQQQVIEKLKAYKQSLITEVVTGKVKIQNSKVAGKYEQYKDSGVDYLAEIPASWTMKRLRYIGSCQNGISKGGEYFGSGYPFVSYGDVYKNIVLPETVNGLIESTEEERENYSVRTGDIFFTRTSETIEEVGFTSVCLKTIENATFAGFVIRVRPNTDDLIPDFSKYYFKSEAHRRFFVKEMNLVTRASLSQDLLKRLPVLIPPKEEQKAIAEYLDKTCATIDSAIEQKQKLIEKLTEYKKSLIYECVTGKKEI